MVKCVNVRSATSSIFLPDNQIDPSELSRRLVSLKEYLIDAMAYDCRNFAANVKTWRDEELFLQFNPTWEEFVSEHFDQSVEWIDHMLLGVELLDAVSPNTPAPIPDAITVSKTASANVAKQLGESPTIEIKAKPGNPTGKNQHTKPQERNYDYNHNSSKPPTGSADPEYLAARIARDRPDIQTKMKQGDYPSVRAAAVDAGIVKPRIQVTWKADADPKAMALAVLKKVPKELQTAFIDALITQVSTEQ